MSLKIKKYNIEESVYDIKVNKNENFYSDGILVHNCAEIIEYSDEHEQAVCNLATMSLPAFIVDGKFDFQLLYKKARQVLSNLNNVIDLNFYPTEETRKSNMLNRPVGLGVQGLADIYCRLKMAFDSPEANELQAHIYETLYFATLTESNELAKIHGPYERFKGSPISEGKFQFDLWNMDYSLLSGMWDWESLRESIIKYGVRNSLVTTQVPSASTAQILGNNESFEPFTSNIFLRRVLSGEYVIVNKYLIDDLDKIGLWNENMKNKIILEKGSVQNIPEIPTELKEIYKTVWEIKQKYILDSSARRGCFIDQSQSLNIFMDKPSKSKLLSAHLHGWKLGLKTGMYYFRTTSATDAIQGLGVEVKKEETITERPENSMFECEGCGA